MKTCDGIPVHCACDEFADVESLKPHPKNPNRHPKSQVKLLARVIEKQGWRVPVTVSKRSGLMIRGHGRLLAALVLGKKQVPVDYQDYDSDEAELADLVADNKIAELADLNLPDIADILREIDLGEFDLDLTGYEPEEIAALLEPDLAPYGGTSTDREGQGISSVWGSIRRKTDKRLIKIDDLEFALEPEVIDKLKEYLERQWNEHEVPIVKTFTEIVLKGMG
jgi:hypothetical protein